MKRVVIAGAGISGLSLAWALRPFGVRVRVFEASPRPGGKLASDRLAGFLVETGPQSFGFRDPAAAALLSQLGLDRGLVRATGAARTRAVVAGGEIRPVPVSPVGFARTKLLPFAAKVRLLSDLALPRGPAASGADESVAEFARRRFGARGAQRLVFPMIPGLYTGDPEVLSLSAAFPGLARLEREHRSVLLGALSGLRAAALGPRLASFEDGMGTLPMEIARRLGPDLQLGATVLSVSPGGSGWRVEVVRLDGERETVDADAVALTLPAHALGPILEDLDPALAAHVARIPYSPVAVAHLGYRREDLPGLPKANGFYTPATEPSALLGGVFTSALFPGHAPPGHHLVACRLGGSRQPQILDLPDDEIADRAHRELERLLGARGAPVFAKVVRHARALPQYTLGHLDRLAAIDGALARHPGLYLAGNAYRGLGILDCLRSAPPLARRMAEHLQWPFPANP